MGSICLNHRSREAPETRPAPIAWGGVSQLLSWQARRLFQALWPVRQQPTRRNRRSLVLHIDELEGRTVPSSGSVPVINLDPDGPSATYSTTYYAKTSGVAVVDVTDATITDAGSATLASLTVRIQNPHDGPKEILFADTTGTAIQASFSGGTLTLSGTDTLADYQQVLRTVMYQDQKSDPNTSAVRNILCVANDGTTSSATMTTYVTVSKAVAQASITSASSSQNPSVYGQTVTLTATVLVSAPATGTPTGTVAFLDGSTTLGTATLNNGTATFAVSALTAGNHSISARYSGDATFQASASTAWSETINPAPLTVTANNASKVYGQSNPPFSVSYAGFVNGDTSGSLGGTLKFTTATNTGSPVGSYSVTPGGLTSGNYTITFVAGTLSITPALLTVTANNTSRMYGQPNPALTDLITGFVNGDNAAVVSGSAALGTAATPSSGVGSYVTTAAQGSLSAANYTFAFVNGTFTVTPAVLTVSADNQSKVYGDANPILTDTITGFVDGDTAAVVSGSAAIGTSATGSSGVGTYAITPAQGSLSAANYTFVFVNSALSVTPAVLTVTADNASRPYGQNNPTFTDTITGFVNGDTTAVLGGHADLSTAATKTSPIGTYTISAAQGDLHAANYTFTFVNGTLTVTGTALTVTADDTSKVAGQANPTFTASYSGFVNGDDPSVLGGTLTFSTPATIASPVGSYPVMPGGLTSSEYMITFVAGTLNVTSAPLSASSTNVVSSGNSSVYGQTVTFTASVSAAGSATGTPTGAVTFVDGANNLGTVPLTNGTAVFTSAALSATTHSITVRYGGDSGFTSSTSSALTQTVGPAPLTVTANNASKVYGQPNPGFAASYSGFVNGDTPGALTGSVVFSTPATVSSPVGSYAIAPSGVTASNYSITFVDGAMDITPALLTVTANDASRTYGAANPAFSDTITGFVNGDTPAVLSGSAGLATAATVSSGVGTYTITTAPGTLSAANYTFAFVTGALLVNPAVLTVTANDASKTYGAANPAFSDTVTGFVNGDTAAVLAGSARLTTTASAGSGVGGYAIAAAQGTLSAANYSFAYVNGTLTVNPAVLTVTANDARRTYGTANPAFTDTIAGFVNGDTIAVLSGSPSLTTTADTGSAAGTYTIVAAQGSLAAVNYLFTFVNGTLTVALADSGGRQPVPTAPVVTAGGMSGLTALPPAALVNSGAFAVAPAGPVLAAGGMPTAPFTGSVVTAASVTASPAPASAAAVAAAAHAAGPHEAVAVDAPAAQVAPAPAPAAPAPAAPAPAAPPVPLSVPPPAPALAIAAPPAPPVPTVSLSAATPAPVLHTEVLWEALDEFQPQIEHRPASTLLRVGVVTSLVASAGYLVFSARASYWLLTLLLARPLVWKRLDPMEVLYAWEKEKQRRGWRGRDRDGADEESLQSLVGARKGAAS